MCSFRALGDWSEHSTRSVEKHSTTRRASPNTSLVFWQSPRAIKLHIARSRVLYFFNRQGYLQTPFLHKYRHCKTTNCLMIFIFSIPVHIDWDIALIGPNVHWWTVNYFILMSLSNIIHVFFVISRNIYRRRKLKWLPLAWGEESTIPNFDKSQAIKVNMFFMSRTSNFCLESWMIFSKLPALLEKVGKQFNPSVANVGRLGSSVMIGWISCKWIQRSFSSTLDR